MLTGTPIEMADLTPAWFSKVLGRDVRSVEIVDAHSGTTGRARVALDAGAGPEPIFVKLAPFTEWGRAFIRNVGIGQSEARFYASLGAEVPVRTPRSYYSAVDDDGGYIMVLEDLVTAGCRFPRLSDDDIVDRVLSTVEELGGLHAAYWESPRFDDDLVWVPVRAGSPATGAANPGHGFITTAVEQFGADFPPAFTRLGELYVSRMDDIRDCFDEGPATLVHGDDHMGNLFVDGTRTGFLDWAMVAHAPGMRDVAYFLGNSVPTDVRA
jgi:hypothetical protein